MKQENRNALEQIVLLFFIIDYYATKGKQCFSYQRKAKRTYCSACAS